MIISDKILGNARKTRLFGIVFPFIFQLFSVGYYVFAWLMDQQTQQLYSKFQYYFLFISLSLALCYSNVNKNVRRFHFYSLIPYFSLKIAYEILRTYKIIGNSWFWYYTWCAVFILVLFLGIFFWSRKLDNSLYLRN